MPEHGWLLTYDIPGNGYYSFSHWQHGFDPSINTACVWPAATLPTSYIRVTASETMTCGGNYGSIPPAVGRRSFFYKPETSLKAGGPVEDYTGQPFDRSTTNWSDKPTGRDQLEGRTRAELESGRYERAEAWYAEQLDPRNHDSATEEDEDCDLSGGAGDPGPGQSGDPYDAVPVSEFPAGGVPATGGQAILRWGQASLNAENEQIDWRGWGYRKILAKHGWTDADRVATIEALGDPSPRIKQVPPDGHDRHEYEGPEYAGRNGASCVRVVEVDHDLTSYEFALNESRPPGIITSFGDRVN